MNQSEFFDEQDVLSDDLEFDVSSAETNIEGRTKDLFVSGGFVGSASAVVTTNLASPGTLVNISSGIVYDSNGKRLVFPGINGLSLGDIIGGTNYIVIAIDQQTTTPVQNPITGVTVDTRQVDIQNFVCLTTFTPGETDASGNPYVLIATITSNGSIEVITDVRQFISVTGLLFWGGTTTGAVNQFDMSILNYPINSSLEPGTTILFTPGTTNTGGSIVAVNGTSPFGLVNPQGGVLLPGELVAGTLYAMVYTGGTYQLIGPDIITLTNQLTIINGEISVLQGQVITLNGEVATLQSEVSALIANPGFQNKPVYYNPGTYVILTGPTCTRILIELTGGSGSGGASYGSGNAGTGGGAGAYNKFYVPVTPNTNYTLVVGAGGVSVGQGISGPGNHGNDGVDSSFGGVTVGGGKGGKVGANNAPTLGGNGGGANAKVFTNNIVIASSGPAGTESDGSGSQSGPYAGGVNVLPIDSLIVNNPNGGAGIAGAGSSGGGNGGAAVIWI